MALSSVRNAKRFLCHNELTLFDVKYHNVITLNIILDMCWKFLSQLRY